MKCTNGNEISRCLKLKYVIIIINNNDNDNNDNNNYFFIIIFVPNYIQNILLNSYCIVR